jgi:CBS-domain-containing membrane protein
MATAHDLMTANPASIPSTAKVRRAVDILQTLDIRHLPLVNEERELIGMLSDRDLRALSVPYFVGEEHVGSLRTALDANVTNLMSGDVISVNEEADAAEIVELMLDHKIGAVPVTDADGTLVGIVSYMDVLRAMPLEAAATE